MKKLMLTMLSVVGMMLFAALPAKACTSYYVGKDCTKDGTTMYGRTEDISSRKDKVYKVIPAKNVGKNAMYKDESGATEFQAFYKVALPLAKPIVATIALFVGIAYWNDWMNGYIYITKNTDLYSVQNLLNRMMQNIQYLSQNSSNIQQAGVGLNAIPTASVRMAMATVGVLPILVVYPFVQKYFVKGITLGGVKG